MKWHFKQWSVAVLLATLAVVAGACDDDGGNVQPTPDGLSDVPNIGDTVVANSYLQVFSPADSAPAKMNYNGDVPIDVGFFGPEDQPIAGATLSFTILQSTDNCHTAAPACVKLASLSGQTDSDGRVQMKVSAGQRDSDATVQITVQGQDTVDPVTVVVQVRSKDSYDFRVEFEYAGIRSFATVKPLLFATKATQAAAGLTGGYDTCAEVFTAPLRNADVLPTASKQVADVAHKPDGSIDPAIFMSIPNGASYIAVGYSLTSGGLVTVYGCNDEIPVLSPGVSTTITVPLTDIPIILAGNYDLTSRFNLLSALPRRSDPADKMQAGDYFDFIVTLFDDPGKAIYGLLKPYIAGVNFGGFTIPEGLDPIIEKLITDAIYDFAPDWLNNGLAIGGDVTEMLTNFTLIGEFEITEEPDLGSGIIPTTATTQAHRYNAIRFRWRLPCVRAGSSLGDCDNSYVTKSFAEIGHPEVSINGVWGGAVAPCTANATQMCITIDPHGLTVPYGDIALAIIEGVVLPELFNDPMINSLDALLSNVLLGFIVDWYNGNRGYNPGDLDYIQKDGTCKPVGLVLADLANLDGIGGSAIEAIGEYACNEGKTFLIDFVREQAANLTLDTQDNLTLSTAGDCAIWDRDGNLEYDQMGDDLSDESNCHWDMNVRFSADGTPKNVTGYFFAERQ